ncbi:MAG: hypothetical protein ABW167_20080 [Baekduia sp.]
MSTSPHPERHQLLTETVVSELERAARERPEELRRIAPGTQTRYGPERVADRTIALYHALLPGDVSIHNMRELAAVINTNPKEAAALMAIPSGPDCPLEPVTSALVTGTTRCVEEFAPEEVHALVIGAPNSPTPGMHKRSHVFGIGPDGNQRVIAPFLTSTYGPHDALGYSIGLGGLLRPSSLDDFESAAAAGRLLSLEDRAAYAAAVALLYAPVVDAARPGRRPLAIAVLNGRRDANPQPGVSLESTVDVLTDFPNWEKTVEPLGRDGRLVVVETGVASRKGGFGLPETIEYVTTDGVSVPGPDVTAALKGQNADAHLLLMDEWEFLPGIHGDDNLETVSVLAFRGIAVDARTVRQSRLFAFLSNATNDLVFGLTPFGGDRGDVDPLPRLAEPGAHTAAKIDLARIARICVGPSRWPGTCRRNALSDAQRFFHLAAKHEPTREAVLAWSSHLRGSDIDYPAIPTR